MLRGIPLSFDTSVGALIQGRTVPIALDLSVIPGDVKASFNGAAVNLAEAPAVKGNIKLEGADLGGFVAALTGAAAPPQIAGRRFNLSGAIAGSQAGVAIKELELGLDGMKARGDVAVELGKIVDAEINLTAGRIDLDKMLAAANSTGGDADAPASSPGRATAKIAPAAKRESDGPMALPKAVNASVNITVDALTYQKIAVRQARLSAALANGEITLSQFSALLPGGTDVAAFGFVTLPGGQPQFDGDVEVRTNDLRGTLKTFGIEIAGIAPERLRKLDLKSEVRANAESLRASKLDLTVDTTKVTGSVTATLNPQPTVAADIVVDKINLDGYLESGAPAAGNGGPVAPNSATSSSGAASSGASEPVETLFDADVKARVKALTYRAVPIRELRIDGSLKDGKLVLRSLTVENAAGVAMAARGTLAGLGGNAFAMTLSDVAYDVRSNDLSQAAKLAGVELPISPRALGQVALNGTASGNFETLDLDTKLAAAEGEFSFAGKVRPLDPAKMLDGRVAVRHPDANRLIEKLGLAYRPAGQLGAVNAAAKAVGGPARIELTAIDGTLGKTSIKGATTIDLSGQRPSIGANIGVGVLDVTPLLPAEKSAALEIPARLIPAAWNGGPLFRPADLDNGTTPVAGPPWTRDPLDLSALDSLNAAVRLTAQALIYQKHRLDGASVDAALQNGVLEARKVAGSIYGGQLDATARLASGRGGADLRTNISLTGADLGRMMQALDQGEIQSGRLDFAANLAGVGGSSADLVQRLNGNGQVAITGARGGSGTFLSGFLGLMGALNQLTPLLGSQKSGATDVSGTFQIVNGVATTQDVKLVSSAGNGTAVARMDLPAWNINSNGEIKLAANLVSILLVDKAGVSPTLPFSIIGPLDDPKYNFDISKLPGSSLKIPGLDKLRKTPGVGDILNQLLPTNQQPAPAPAPAPAPTQRGTGTLPPPPPPPTQEQQQQPEKPADVLKNILKGLGR